MKEALLYTLNGKDEVRCLACQWYCSIPNGKTGICGVRLNLDGTLQLLVYGKPASVQLDPIEKKPFFHFLPGQPVFSLGTLGCNFQCDFCQNWDISQVLHEARQQKDLFNLEEIIGKGNGDWLPEKIVAHCVKNHIPAIAYTYNEPAIFFEYAFDTAKLAHEKGLKNVFVSNGFNSPESIEKIGPYLDAINIDLKAFSETFYRKHCKARLAGVLQTIEKVSKTKIWLEVTTLLIPGENDSETEIMQAAGFLAKLNTDIPWHITAFHPEYRMLEKKATSVDRLLRAQAIGKKAGLKYVYAGNVITDDGETTFCPKCQLALIRRNWHEVLENKLKKGHCPDCGETIAGVWS